MNPLLDEVRNLTCALEATLTTPPVPLAELDANAPGAYVMLYCGDLDVYARLRRPGGRDDLRPIAAGGGAPLYVGSAKELRERAGRYRTKLRGCIDVHVEDMLVVAMPTASHAGALYVEGLLIAAFAPVWNEPWLSGFGSKPQGSIRTRHQRVSAWQTLHPAVNDCGAPAADTSSAAHLRTRAANHLNLTVPGALTIALAA